MYIYIYILCYSGYILCVVFPCLAPPFSRSPTDVMRLKHRVPAVLSSLDTARLRSTRRATTLNFVDAPRTNKKMSHIIISHKEHAISDASKIWPLSYSIVRKCQSSLLGH